jgi:glycosyltransferase involved in cell wall biosynthesis
MARVLVTLVRIAVLLARLTVCPMTLPMISIVTPSLNQGRFLERSIRSVLDQEYPNVEHIVIDGGSDDGTVETLKGHPHLLWISERDRGQSHALNKGFAMAQGDLVAELDVDDELTPGALAAVGRAAAESGGEKVILGAVELLYEAQQMRIMSNRPQSLFRYLNPWIPRTNFSQPGVFIPKAIFDSIGKVDERLSYTMDYDLFCRMLKQGVEFCSVDRVVARYHLHPDCKTGRGWHVTYPELDAVVLRHARALEGLQRPLFGLSFTILRPLMRRLSRAAFPPVY